jgi:hypothetical protein
MSTKGSVARVHDSLVGRAPGLGGLSLVVRAAGGGHRSRNSAAGIAAGVDFMKPFRPKFTDKNICNWVKF